MGSPLRASGSLTIRNVHLAFSTSSDEAEIWDVFVVDGKVTRVVPAPSESTNSTFVHSFFGGPDILDAHGRGLLLPSLCHAHIHLDKPFLLDRCDLRTGSFAEALSSTATAKAQFPFNPSDLYTRGARLLRESVAAGVTAIRAHIEVDATVGFTCFEVAKQLKSDFSDVCDVQITVFAQDPLFDSSDATEPGPNYSPFSHIASSKFVSAIGSAPYVERTPEQASRNVKLVLDLAEKHNLLADFHLDYNVDPSRIPQIYELSEELKRRSWRTPVALGHCTRLSLFNEREWATLANELRSLPITLVALPQSDVYMARAPSNSEPSPRGTIPVDVVAQAGIRVASAVNNVANAFTPQGTSDPMSLGPLGVALYQNPTAEGARLLLRCITTAAKAAIGLAPPESLPSLASEIPVFHGPQRETPFTEDIVIREGDAADFVLLHDNASALDAVMRPSHARTTIYGGCIVGGRTGRSWVGGHRDTWEEEGSRWIASDGSRSATRTSWAEYGTWLTAGIAIGAVFAVRLREKIRGRYL